MELPVQILGHRKAGVRLTVAQILGNRFLKEIGRLLERLAGPDRPPQHLAPKQEKVVRLAVGRFDGVEPRGLAWAQLDLQGVYDPAAELLPDCEDCGVGAIE